MPHVQSRSATGSGTSLVLAYLSTPAAGNLLAAGVGSGDGGDQLTTVADNNSNAWGEARAHTRSTAHGAIWYAPDSNAGAATVTATWSASQFASNICIAEYDEIETASPLDQTNVGDAFAQTYTSGNITTTQADELIIAIASCGAAGAAFALDADFSNERADTGSNRSFQYIDDIIASTQTLNSTHTHAAGNADGVAVIASFKIAAIPGTAVVTGTMVSGGVTEAEMVSG